MANNAANVSAGKPKASGAIYSADITAELPTNAVDALVEQYKGLGYVSEDGLTNAVSTESKKIKAWGGDTVLSTGTSRDETFTFKFIETNALVMKEVYGQENVTVDSDTGALAVIHKSVDYPKRRYVFEMALTGNRVKRIVVPQGKVEEIGEIVYVDGDAIGYEVTLGAYPDGTGATAYEYIAQAA